MPEDDRITVQGHEMVVRKQPADVQDHLSDHILDEVRVGNTKNELDKVGNTGIGALIFCVQARVNLARSVVVANFRVLRYSIFSTCGLIW